MDDAQKTSGTGTWIRDLFGDKPGGKKTADEKTGKETGHDGILIWGIIDLGR
jgi:hypothetical protein